MTQWHVPDWFLLTVKIADVCLFTVAAACWCVILAGAIYSVFKEKP